MESAVKEGLDYMILQGQRQRYQYYSFEKTGLAYRFDLTKTNLKHAFASFNLPNLKLQELKADDFDKLQEIAQMHSSCKLHFDRPLNLLFETLISTGSRPYYALLDGELVGYLVIDKDLKLIQEFYGKNREISQTMLGAALNLSQKESLSFSLPPSHVDEVELLSRISEISYISPDGNYTVLNYHRVIRAMMDLQASIRPLADGQVILNIRGFAGNENIKISVIEGVPSVNLTNEVEDLRLDHMDAMNFLFSPVCPARAKLGPAQASWFPLPLHTPALDNA